MRFGTFLTRGLVLGCVLLIASACETRGPTSPVFPSAADLRVETKPLASIATLTSEAAHVDHDIAIEAWGERGWLIVARNCRWAVASGAKLPFKCPPPAASK